MSSFYEAIGRLVVFFVLRRFRRELKIAGAVGVAVIAVAAYLAATRDVEEG